MSEPRPIEEIYAELAAHPDFVIGGYLTRDHVIDAGWSPDRLPSKFADNNAEAVSDLMYELVEEGQS